MKCDLARVSALLDGEDEAYRPHAESCEACRKELAAMTLMRDGLASLPAPEPRGDGWLALAKQLNTDMARPRRSWRRWVLVPAFGTLAAAIVLFQLRHRAPSDEALIAQAEAEFRGAEAQYQRALTKLSTVVQHAREEWPEARKQEYDAALAALESATEQCRKVAQKNPDADAEEVLFAAYRKQIHFYEEQLLK
jgi:hypothetical protein